MSWVYLKRARTTGRVSNLPERMQVVIIAVEADLCDEEDYAVITPYYWSGSEWVSLFGGKRSHNDTVVAWHPFPFFVPQPKKVAPKKKASK